MEVLEYALCQNRRIDFRETLSQSAEYISANRESHQTQVLNVSSQGARLTTDTKVKVGDFIRIVSPLVKEIAESTATVVRWVKPLPGGQRQIVGVQTLRAAYAL